MRLMAEIDGQTLPLHECFWLRVDSRGCAWGSLHGDQAATAEQAHKVFVPRQRDRDRDERQGYTIRLVTHQQWREQAEPCFGRRCQHHQGAAS